MSTTIEAPRIAPNLETETTLQPATAEAERQPESVLRLLLERVERGYRRGIDNDGHKIGLAFDPGGLAGIVSEAMAKKLSLTGALDCIDGFYGLSAGGLNAIYTAAGQIDDGIDCYINLMPDNQLVEDPKLLPPKLPKMDLDVVREALLRQHPVNVKKIIEKKIPVIVGATNLSDPIGRPVIFRSTEADPAHPEEFIEKVIAGSHIPVVAGEPVKLSDGNRYTDATMTWSNSIELARADGCTDVLSLANLARDDDGPADRKAELAGRLVGKLGDKYLDKHSPNLPPPYPTIEFKQWLRHPARSLEQTLLDYISGDRSYVWDIKTYAEALKRKGEAEKLFTESTFMVNGVNVERLYPPDIPELPQLLTMDKKKLRVGIIAGRLSARKALRDLGH